MDKLALIKSLIIIIVILTIAMGITILIVLMQGKQDDRNTLESVSNIINSNIIQNNVSVEENINVENNIIENNNQTQENILQTIQGYFYNYTSNILENPEISYNLLDVEYREKRFGSIDAYKEYVKKIGYKIDNAIIVQYGVEERGEYIEYAFMDNYSNTYVIRANSSGYKIIADMYTIDIDTVAEKYDDGSDKQKIIINIQKIISALNSRDYKYVYNKLSEDFKKTKYPTIEQFETEMDDKIYGTFSVVFNEYTEKEDCCVYDINIVGDNASSTNLNMQITMELKEQRDYTMSFEIKEVN